MDYESSSRGALQWMQARKHSGNFLFRGQSSIYGSVPPSLFRAHISQEQRTAWWRVRKNFVSRAKQKGLFGYRVPTYHDADAMLQHYLIKSAAIDVTGTPEIALYFALSGGGSGPGIVYAIDIEDVKSSGLAVTDHDFLAAQSKANGTPHRWLRQDGFTVGVDYWNDFGAAGKLDLLKVPGLKEFRLSAVPEDVSLVAKLGDLETVERDDLAEAIPSIFQEIAEYESVWDIVSVLMPSASKN